MKGDVKALQTTDLVLLLCLFSLTKAKLDTEKQEWHSFLKMFSGFFAVSQELTAVSCGVTMMASYTEVVPFIVENNVPIAKCKYEYSGVRVRMLLVELFHFHQDNILEKLIWLD